MNLGHSIKERKTVMIYNDSTGGAVTGFNFPITLNFIPDEIIVRQVSISTAAAGNTIINIHSSLIDDGGLLSINNMNNTVNLENIFYNNKQIRGTYSFSFRDCTNPFFQLQSLAIQISFFIDFIKYK